MVGEGFPEGPEASSSIFLQVNVILSTNLSCIHKQDDQKHVVRSICIVALAIMQKTEIISRMYSSINIRYLALTLIFNLYNPTVYHYMNCLVALLAPVEFEAFYLQRKSFLESLEIKGRF